MHCPGERDGLPRSSRNADVLGGFWHRDNDRHMPKAIPGPTFKLDNSLPCGCRIGRDDGTLKFRLWYCPTHAAAFEILEALRTNLSALDELINSTGGTSCDLSQAMDAGMRARIAIRRATTTR
jgi:hypothetical protein